MARTLFGFPFQVWAMMAIEFTERLGYYGVSSMLMMYCTYLLRMSPPGANAVVNGLYSMTPVAACISSGLSDGYLGRPLSLLIFMTTYAVGLSCVALSAFPFMFGDFPYDPLVVCYVTFGIGMVLYACGFGGMKVCTNPMMADSVVDVCRDNEVKRDALLSRLFRWVYWATNCGSLIGMLVAPLMRKLDPHSIMVGEDKMYVGYYYGFSMGAGSCIVGVLLFCATYRRFRVNERAPSFVLFRIIGRALRIRYRFLTRRIVDDAFLNAPGRTLLDFAGYGYVRDRGSGFSRSGRTTEEVKSAASGMVESAGPSSPRFLVDHTIDVEEPLLRHQDSPTQGLPVGAVVPEAEVGIAVGSVTERSAESVTEENLYEAMDSTEGDHDIHCISSPGWVRDAKATMSVCRALMAMPVYWLITNQFSTNMLLQVVATDLPPEIPPEMFSNVNTVSLLLSIVILDRAVYPLLFGERKPPVRGRVAAGFALMVFSMLWCGVLQLYIYQRGEYRSGAGGRGDEYYVRDGETKVSALWLLLPYILQGTASALVDATVMEVAYTLAPVRMKSAVMALYLIASSISGFLGLALSPVMTPPNAATMFFAFGMTLSIVATLFVIFNGPTQRARHELLSEETHLLRRAEARRRRRQRAEMSESATDHEAEPSSVGGKVLPSV